MPEITKEAVLNTLKEHLELLPYVHAMWEGGAAAWGRVDEWSDIDLQLDVEDDRLADAFRAVEEALETLAPIEHSYRLPYPESHPYWQSFYRLEGASPYLLLDLAVFRHSAEDKMLELELHGPQVIWFDKVGVVKPAPFDRQKHAERLASRRESLKTEFSIFQVMVLKEIRRRHPVEAIPYYFRHTLQPLMQMLGMKYRPERYHYHTRYIYTDFPPEVIQRLETLFFVKDLDELEEHHQEAAAWFWELMEADR